MHYTPPTAADLPHRQAYDVACLIIDCRHIAATLPAIVPESMLQMTLEDLNRISALANAVSRLFAQAETAALRLASDLQDLNQHTEGA